MKQLLFTLFWLCSHGAAYACEVCKKRQPKPLRGITHGAGPESDWDYVIVSVVAVVVVVSLFYSVKWLIRPGERSPEHIKNSVLNFE